MENIKVLYKELKEECFSRGIHLETGKKYTKDDLLLLLRNNSITPKSPMSHKYLRYFYSPMLCHLFNTLKKDEQKAILEDKNWICEPKYYGNRVFITYFKGEGFKIFSRKLSEITFLPEEITEKLYFQFPNISTDISFIMDGMIVLDTVRSKSDRDPYLSLEDNAVTYIMSLPTEESIAFQIKYAKMSIVALDLLMIDSKNSSSLPLFKRRKLLEDLVYGRLKKLKEPLNFLLPPQVSEDKIDYFEHCIDNGYQGVVLKNSNKSYNYNNKRLKDLALKIKRNCCSYTDDIDLFISGVDREGNIELSSYFEDSKGNMYEAVIGTTPPPDNIKKQFLFNNDFFGDYTLDPDLFGKVVVVRASGFDLVKKRYNTVYVKWSKGYREDKHRLDCILQEDIVGAKFLRNVIR